MIEKEFPQRKSAWKGSNARQNHILISWVGLLRSSNHTENNNIVLINIYFTSFFVVVLER